MSPRETSNHIFRTLIRGFHCDSPAYLGLWAWGTMAIVRKVSFKHIRFPSFRSTSRDPAICDSVYHLLHKFTPTMRPHLGRIHAGVLGASYRSSVFARSRWPFQCRSLTREHLLSVSLPRERYVYCIVACGDSNLVSRRPRGCRVLWYLRCLTSSIQYNIILATTKTTLSTAICRRASEAKTNGVDY
ncbi:hypothetical protein BJV74DRAFT_372063 [Russula compacta]|nr:hypothetical protein BJV74DRAFT_372063 [Russula compacta]